MARVAPRYGEKIRAARRHRGLSLRGLAEAAGVNPSFVSRLENGEIHDMSLTRAVAFCDILGLSLEQLVGRKP